MSHHATTFRRLHEDGLLILPNAWDAGTAKLVEAAGAPAIATTSAGVAWSHGYPDGNALPVDLMAATVAAIVRVVKVPLSVDVEGGYAEDVDGIAGTVRRLADLGAVGVNIEDATDAPEALCRKIEAIKKVAPGVFVNARTDVYLKGLVPEPQRIGETLAREQQYRDAGADGIFVPGVTDAGVIGTLVGGVQLPLNVLARPGLPDAAGLRALGVRRLSAGSWITSNVYGRIGTLAAGFLRDGNVAPLFDGARPYAEVNTLLGG